MKKLLFLLALALPLFAAGSVQITINKLGSTDNWVAAFNWQGDASTGAVPTTSTTGQNNLNCCQGYNVTQVETVPGSPAPTSGYSLQIQDGSGADLLGGAAAGLSATSAQLFSGSPSAPPLQGTLTMVISGQSVASAKGRVYVFLSKPGTVNLAALKRSFSSLLTPEFFGAVGDGATDDTASLTASIVAANAGGLWLLACKKYLITSDIIQTVTSSFVIDGCGTGMLQRQASSGTVYALKLQGAGAGNQTNVTAIVNGNFAGRATSTTTTIAVASTTGISVGKWLQLTYNASATRYFQQSARVATLVGTTITFDDAIGIPMDSAQANTVTVLNPFPAVTIRDLTIDGSKLSGSFNGGGVLIDTCLDCTFTGITVQNFPTGVSASDLAPWTDLASINASYTSLRSVNAGRHNGDFWWDIGTNVKVNGFKGRIDNPALTDSHGPDIQAVTNGQFSNFELSGYSGRCSRLLMDAHIQLSNWKVNKCDDNGMFVTWNTYQVHAQNIQINQATSTSSIAIGGDDESYIFIDGYSGANNGVPATNFDIGLFNSTHHVFINGYQCSGTTCIVSATAASVGAPNTAINIAGGSQLTQQFGCTGVATSSQTLFMTVIPPGACTNTTNNSTTQILVPVPGVLRNLQVTSSAAGHLAGSGLVTVTVIGIGVVLSCTIGTGTSCSDTLNMIQVNAGAVLYVTYTTQAVETLANLKVSFEY